MATFQPSYTACHHFGHSLFQSDKVCLLCQPSGLYFNFKGTSYWIKQTCKPYTLVGPTVTRPPSCNTPSEPTISPLNILKGKEYQRSSLFTAFKIDYECCINAKFAVIILVFTKPGTHWDFWNGKPFPCNGLLLCCVNLP